MRPVTRICNLETRPAKQADLGSAITKPTDKWFKQSDFCTDIFTNSSGQQLPQDTQLTNQGKTGTRQIIMTTVIACQVLVPT